MNSKLRRVRSLVATLILSAFFMATIPVRHAEAATIMTGNITWHGISVPTAAFRVDNIFGGVNGWNSLITVFPTVTDAKAGTNQINQINLPFPYTAGHDPVSDIQAALLTQYPGLTVAP